MKKLYPFIILILIACTNGEHKSGAITENVDGKVTSLENEQESIQTSSQSFKFNCDNLPSTIKNLEGDIVEIRLTEEELEEKKFKAVEQGFYDKYIKGNPTFRKWNTSSEEDYWEAKHYYWGKINRSGKCILIIYEYFTLNHSEDKLFLMLFDKNGELQDVKQVAEITHYPGAIQSTYAKISNETLTVYAVLDGILEYAGENEKNQYSKDSTVLTYNIKKWNKLHQVDSVTISTEYWQ